MNEEKKERTKKEERKKKRKEERANAILIVHFICNTICVVVYIYC